MKVILGSASAKRKVLLEQADIKIGTVITPDVDEKAIREKDHLKLVQLLANAKRDALLARISEPAFLITADTILFRGDDLFEKPLSADEERKFLKAYDGKTPFGFATAITVTNIETKETREGLDVGELVMGPFNDAFIERYIAKGTYGQYAGGFTYMDPEFPPAVKSLKGGTDTLMGMPVELCKSLLKQLGWKEID